MTNKVKRIFYNLLTNKFGFTRYNTSVNSIEGNFLCVDLVFVTLKLQVVDMVPTSGGKEITCLISKLTQHVLSR